MIIPKEITVEDLQQQYEALITYHLQNGGQYNLDNCLAFQRVLKFYMLPEDFSVYMDSLQDDRR